MVKIFYNPNAPFKNMVADDMKPVHDNFLINAIGDDNWDISNVEIKGDSNIIDSIMSYTMEYNGMRYPTAKLYKKG